MPTTDELRHYHVFVLRAWEERGSPIGPARWRFSLEAPSTGQRRGFATLEALIAFLTNQLVHRVWSRGSRLTIRERMAKVRSKPSLR